MAPDSTAKYKSSSACNRRSRRARRRSAFGTLSIDIPTKDEGGTGYYQFSLEVPSLFGPTNPLSPDLRRDVSNAGFTVKVERPERQAVVFGDSLVAEIKGDYLHGARWSWRGRVHLSRAETDFRPPAPRTMLTFGSGNHYWGPPLLRPHGEWAATATAALA